ncbi:beta-ketoacyl synthase N-terminal-like domain-containing protein (plasmid) [Streptomyces sp. HUAS TT11]|uniref:beta-ketoacyl synthase N-terminal-like domain-containing protein n=1 Tax=Streptomyces sp. HUAS TT11 TaxID=3447508 RepID=UPI003F65AC11
MTWDITGLGAVANLGVTPEEIYGALCAGKETRTPLNAFDTAQYRARYAYEIDDRAGGEDEPLRATKWLTAAVRQALADASLPEDLSGIPVLIGTTMREQRSAELWWTKAAGISPGDLYFGGALQQAFGAISTYTFANACSASLYALGMGADMIDLGLADAVVVAGTDSMTESAFGTLDKVQNDTPDALRPFDVSHKGMLMGEGAVAVVLRRTGTHGTPTHARLKSVSMNCDAFHPTAPDHNGIRAAVSEAHERAGVTPADIDLVMLHGSGTPRNDETEAAVLADIFAATGHRPWMTAIKSMTGHTLGGSGLLSLVMALLAMRHGAVPPVLGLSEPIEEATALSLVQNRAVEATVGTAQVNAFGFGGINAVAIVEAAR